VPGFAVFENFHSLSKGGCPTLARSLRKGGIPRKCPAWDFNRRSVPNENFVHADTDVIFPGEPRSSSSSRNCLRPAVATFSYLYELPAFVHAESLRSKLANGWGISGLMVFESGQPYNVYDFSGSVGSLYYSANDFITNPTVPLAPGFTPKSAQQHIAWTGWRALLRPDHDGF
jgi:hypothetical protein